MAAEAVAVAGTTATFRRVYETLKAELLQDSAFDFNEDAVQWIDGMLDYNVLGGKLNHGLAVIESYKLLKAGSEPTEDEVFLACILGWGIEWLQAYFLILDDIMDNSQTRRGKPCWYTLSKEKRFYCTPPALGLDAGQPFRVGHGSPAAQVIQPSVEPEEDDAAAAVVEKNDGVLLPKTNAICAGGATGHLVAINDGLVLHSQISRIFKRYFYGKTYYVDLLDLFNEVEFKTTSGELLDQITANEGKKDLSKYTTDNYRRIVEYKTAYYSFYLPVACALLLSGWNLDDYVETKHILVEMGVYFQIQDDYLDCFGDPEVMGKIGTDIEDFKCSWLFVQALVRVNERQKDILFENYGKSDPACVEKVKALYKELNLEEVFSQYERETYEKLTSDIEAQPNEAVQAVLKSFLHKIYRRRK